MHVKILMISIFAIVSFFFLTPDAEARKSLRERYKNQRARIEKGVESGEMTKREARRSKRSLKKNRKRTQAMRDRNEERMGSRKLTGRQKRKLRRSMNKNSKRIYKNKHDEQKRGWKKRAEDGEEMMSDVESSDSME